MKRYALAGLVVPMLATLLAITVDSSAQEKGGFTVTGGTAKPGDEKATFEGFFAEGNRLENFRHVDRFGPTSAIPPAAKPGVLPQQLQPIQFKAPYLGQPTSLEDFLSKTSTSAFLLIKDGVVVDERYFHGNDPAALNAAFSVSKSFISALVGIAISEGHIGSVNDPVTRYVKELSADAYKGVTIKHLLQMSSGLKFNEDYADPESDINKMRYMVQSMSYVDYLNTLQRAEPPGTVNRYVSVNTQLLGIVVARATGQPLSKYLQEKLWEPMGMEQGARWMLDAQGLELGMGGLALSLRDYARFGLLYLNDGRWLGNQVLPAGWVKQSVVPDAPYLQSKGNDFGYQYQWWTPDNPDGEFMALGIWGQYVYVDPKRAVVIVKLSADPSSFSPSVQHAQVGYLRTLSRQLDKANPRLAGSIAK